MPPKDIPMPFRTALPWTGFVALLFLLNYMSLHADALACLH